MTHWLALLLAIAANISGNLALKQFSQQMSEPKDLGSLLTALTHPAFWIGGLSAGVVFFSYIWALRGVPLSVAYPIGTGVSAAGVLIAAALVLGESVGLAKIIGVGLVVAGVLLITR